MNKKYKSNCIFFLSILVIFTFSALSATAQEEKKEAVKVEEKTEETENKQESKEEDEKESEEEEVKKVKEAIISKEETKVKEDTAKKITKINVTAHLYPVDTKKTASLVEEISAEEIANVWGNDTLKAIQSLSGVNIIQYGGASGQVASLFLRGGLASDVLILVDGIELKDPSSPDRSIDISFIDFNNVERIEVLKGPSSGIYGSDAMTGVIHIITKKPKMKDGIYSTITSGSYDTISSQKTIIKNLPKVRYQASLKTIYTKGISTVKEANAEPERIDDDGYLENAIAFQADRKLSEKFQTNVVLKYKHRELEYDDFNTNENLPVEDPNAESDQTYFLGMAKLTANFIPNTLKSSFSFEHSLWNRKYKIDPTSEDFYRSHMEKFLLLNHVKTSLFATSTLGLEYEKETMHSESIKGKSTDTLGTFLEQRMDIDPFFGAANIRYEHNSKAGDSLSYRLSLGATIENTNATVRGSYGKSKRRPSLFQLFDPQYGNPDLEKESLKGFDLGLEYSWKNETIYKANYFNYDAKNRVVWENQRYINLDKSKLSGIELGLSHPLHKDKISFSGSYTHLIDANDKATDKRFVYRPKHTIHGALHFKPYKPVKLNLLIEHSGRRYVDSSNTSELPSHVLLHITANVQIKENSNLFFKVNNILDKQYEVIQHYNTLGRSFFITWNNRL